MVLMCNIVTNCTDPTLPTGGSRQLPAIRQDENVPTLPVKPQETNSKEIDNEFSITWFVFPQLFSSEIMSPLTTQDGSVMMD